MWKILVTGLSMKRNCTILYLLSGRSSMRPRTLLDSKSDEMLLYWFRARGIVSFEHGKRVFKEDCRWRGGEVVG